MFFYIFIYILVAFLYYLYRSKAYPYISIVILLLAYFRPDNVGSDFIGYMRLIRENYYDVSLNEIVAWYSKFDFQDRTYGIGASKEFGFSFLIMIIKSFVNNPRAIVNIVVTLILFVYIQSFKRICNKENIALCLFLYFSIFLFYSTLNTLRQSLSVAIIVFAISLLSTKKYIQTAMFVVIACTIHSSALIIAPILFIYFIKIRFKVVYTVFSILLLLDLFNIKITYIIEIFPDDFMGKSVSSALWGEASSIYNQYIDYMSFVFNCIMVYVFCWFYKKANKDDMPFFSLWFIGLAMYIPLMISPNVGRLSEFLYVFQIFTIVKTLNYLKIADIKAYGYGIQLTFGYVFIWYMFYCLRNWYGIIPYLTF